MMEMQGNATEIDERNLLQLDALLSHGYGLSPQLVMRSKGLSIEAKALYGYLSSFAGAGDTAFPSTSRILEELDISKNRFYKIRKELISWGFISIETTATSAGLRTVYTLPQNPIAIKTEIDEIANRRNEIKSSLVANLHNEDMVSHKGDSESERLQQLAGNEPCRQSEAKAQNRGSNLKPCLQSEDEGCLQSGDKLYIDTSINPKVSIDRSATRPSDDEVPSNWKVIEGMTDTTLRDDGESDRDANGRDALDAVPDGTYDPLPTVADGYTLSRNGKDYGQLDLNDPAVAIMRLLVMFDLPTKTKTDKDNYIKFKRFLEDDGYQREQNSVYSRNLLSRSSCHNVPCILQDSS